jgi:hypothetical protein
MPVVHQSNLQGRITLRDDHSSYMVSLPIHYRKTPDLLSSPSRLFINNITLNKVAVSVEPVFLEEVVRNLGVVEFDPAAVLTN